MLSPLKRHAATLEQRFRLVTFAGTLLPTVAALAVQLAAFAITARGLGVDAFGAYTALLAVAVVSVELIGLGGADLLVRGVAQDRSRFAETFGNLLILFGATLPVVAAIGVWIAVDLMGTTLSLAAVAMVIVGEMMVGRAAASLELVMVAHRHTVRAGAIRLTTAVLRLFLATLVFLVLDRHDLDFWIEATFAQSIATTIGYGLVAVWLYGSPRWTLLTGEIRAGFAFCVNQASRSSQGNVDRIILSRFADDATVGVYGAASRVLALGLFPIQVVTRITYPNFFTHGKNGIAASRRYGLKVAPIMLAVGIAASAAVAVAGYLAPTILGADFAGMADITAKLGLALPLIALQYPPADALTGAGFQGIRAVLSVCATFGFGLVMALGTRLGGIDGLVGAFLLSHASLALAMWTALFVVSRGAKTRQDVLGGDAAC